MMILKILVLLIIIYIIYLIFFKSETVSDKKQGTFKNKNPFKKRETKEESEIMVECSKCGIFISSKEAIIKDGKYYCSKECAGVK